jgi:hypothetical protein
MYVIDTFSTNLLDAKKKLQEFRNRFGGGNRNANQNKDDDREYSTLTQDEDDFRHL